MLPAAVMLLAVKTGCSCERRGFPPVNTMREEDISWLSKTLFIGHEVVKIAQVSGKMNFDFVRPILIPPFYL